MFGTIRFILIFILISTLFVVTVHADYTFSDNFDTDLNSEWVGISGHILPSISGNSLEFNLPTPSRRFPYISHQYSIPIRTISFDFRYELKGTDFGSGIIVTENPPTQEISPPNDSGDYILGVYVLQGGKFYIISPLCLAISSCGMQIHPYAILELAPNVENNLRFEFSLNYLDVYSNNVLIRSLPMNSYRADGVFLGNSMVTESSKIWQHFWVDNFFINYSDYSSPTPSPVVTPSPTPTPTPFPYLSQSESPWGEQEYDTASTWAGGDRANIDRWGCAITSVAMILNHYGINDPGGSPVDPGNLNAWLKGQPDGYIAPGLLNWIAITRYVKQSYDAGHADTKLEFVRTLPEPSPILPAILGLPGHFVVAHADDTDNWMIRDPADSLIATLVKTASLRSINRYVPSLTDLTNMLFTMNPGVSAVLRNQLGEIIPINWVDEFLNDDVSGTPSALLRVGIVPKPGNDRYRLTVNQPPGEANELGIYLYDQLAETTPNIFPLHEIVSTFDINYASESAGVRNVMEIDLTPPPVPILLSPQDGAHVRPLGLILDWSDVADFNEPVTYKYRSSWTGGSYGPVSTGSNSFINASGSSDRAYAWQVQACDSVGNCSEWSSPFGLIVDSVAPTLDLVFPLPGSSSNYFEAVFSEMIAPQDATSGANYFLTNWPGAGGSGDLLGDTNITYNSESRTARITFVNPGWYISPEQVWGVQNIHDLAGNLIAINPYTEYSTPNTPPTLSSHLITNPNPTALISQYWSWLAGNDIGSGIKGYSARAYDDLNDQYVGDWLWLGNVLGLTTNLTEGKWKLSLRATDNAGNLSTVLDSSTLTVDTTVPTTPINLHFDNPSLVCPAFTNILTVTFDWDNSTDNVGVAGYEYNVDYPLPGGSLRGSWTPFFTTSSYRGSLNEGIHYLKVRARDEAGNYSPWSSSCTITYDSITPILQTKSNFSGWYKNGQTSYFDFYDLNMVDSYLTPSCEIASEGIGQTCNITPSVCDKANNCYTSLLVSNPANIDMTKPTLNLAIWGRTLAGSAADLLSGVERVEISITKPEEVESTIVATGTTSWSYSMSDAPLGHYKARMVAYDYAGNISDEVTTEYDINETSALAGGDGGSVQGVSTGVIERPIIIPPKIRTEPSISPEMIVTNKEEARDFAEGEVLGKEESTNKLWWIFIASGLIGTSAVSIILWSRGRRD